MTMLDRKTTTYARPALQAYAELEVPHKKSLQRLFAFGR